MEDLNVTVSTNSNFKIDINRFIEFVEKAKKEGATHIEFSTHVDEYDDYTGSQLSCWKYTDATLLREKLLLKYNTSIERIFKNALDNNFDKNGIPKTEAQVYASYSEAVDHLRKDTEVMEKDQKLYYKNSTMENGNWIEVEGCDNKLSDIVI